MSNLLEISAKVKKAIERVSEEVAERVSRPSVKTYKAKVTTAPSQVSGSTKYTCGVTLVGDQTELTVLCPPRMISAQVGDMVWVQVLYSNWKNAVLWQKYDFSTDAGGDGTDVYVNGILQSRVDFSSDPQTQINNKLDTTGDGSDVTVTIGTETKVNADTDFESGSKLSKLWGKAKAWFAALKTVAFTGNYSDLTGTPTIPTVNDGTLTIQKNGTTIQTFTANQSGNATANITVPTQTSDLNNDSGFITSSALSNPNILINSNFAINQSGVTSISSGTGYLADVFYKVASGNYMQVDINGNEVTITAKNHLSPGSYSRILGQFVEVPLGLIGKDVTFSVNCTAAASNYYAIQIHALNSSLNSIGTSGTTMLTSTGVKSITWTIPTGTYCLMCDIIAHLGNAVINEPVTTKEWKLEIGSFATAYTPPNMTEELIKCQRYYVVYDNLVAPAVATGPTAARFTIFTPVEMRVKPTVTTSGTGTINIIYNGAKSATNLNVYDMNANAVTVTLTSSGLTADRECVFYIASGLKMAFDARF